MEYLLKMLFFANIASNLKVESMHFAHRNCEYILGVIYLFVFPVLLWADNKVNTYHFKSISTSVNFPTNEVRKLFQDSQGYIWISTYNGLLRYDGYSIVVYKPMVFRSISRSENMALSLQMRGFSSPKPRVFIIDTKLKAIDYISMILFLIILSLLFYFI